jgi:hypothetical protein
MVHAPTTGTWRRARRLGGSLSIALAVATATLVACPHGASARGRADRFAGRWIATDAVGDDERAAVVTIVKQGPAYELIDRDIRPRQALLARARGNRLVFTQDAGGPKTYSFTATANGRTLSEEIWQPGSSIQIHYVRGGTHTRKPRRHR